MTIQKSQQEEKPKDVLRSGIAKYEFSKNYLYNSPLKYTIMKIKVTFRLLGRKDTTVTIEVPHESISDMLKEECFNEIYKKAQEKTEGRTRYGYVRKIEDKDY